MGISIADLKIETKRCSFEMPGLEGFKVTLNYVSREMSKKLYSKATKTEWKNKRPTESFDNDLFLKLLVEYSFVGWEGLKGSYLEELILVDLGSIDKEDCIDFSPENAQLLLQGSERFDQMINDHIYDLQSFQD